MAERRRSSGSALPQLPGCCSLNPRRRRRLHATTSIPAITHLVPILVLVLLAISSTCTAAVLDRRKSGVGAKIVVDREDFAKRIDHLPREDRRGVSNRARQDNGDPLGGLNDGGSSSAAPSPTSKSPATSTAQASLSATDAATAPSQAPMPPASMPRVFDTPMGNNFSSPSCPAFFQKFLNDPSFINCVPISLLLLNSQAFFQTESLATSLDRVLDASCSVVGANCNTLMQSYATQLLDPANCGDDYQKEQPSVLRAYLGLVAYLPIQQSSCLKLDPDGLSASKASDGGDNDYCFTNSVNNSNQADNSLYYVPLGVTLPGNSRPTCSSCVQQTMALFATAAQNLSTPLGKDYSAAAVQVNQGCGPTFVNASVQPLAGTGGTSRAVAVPVGTVICSLVAVTAALFFV